MPLTISKYLPSIMSASEPVANQPSPPVKVCQSVLVGASSDNEVLRRHNVKLVIEVFEDTILTWITENGDRIPDVLPYDSDELLHDFGYIVKRMIGACDLGGNTLICNQDRSADETSRASTVLSAFQVWCNPGYWRSVKYGRAGPLGSLLLPEHREQLTVYNQLCESSQPTPHI